MENEHSLSGKRELSAIDKLIGQFDRAVRTLHPGATRAHRASPAAALEADTSSGQTNRLNAAERKHAAGLMRINHTGEVCAQALYAGQSLTARDPAVEAAMLESALEEEDHLAWCEQRLEELDSRTSLLNPLFYGASFVMGAAAGIVGDRFSLGFIEATEDRVCQHLEDHLQELPAADQRSRAIVSTMIEDEMAHGQKALDQGGERFSEAQKNAMASVAKLMTWSTYRI